MPQEASPAIMAADALEGDRVLDRDGQPLGAIDDIMVDVERGIIAYAVMSGEELRAIPWSALTFDADRRCFVLDAAPPDLAREPR